MRGPGKWLRGEEGAVAPLLALSLVGLVGMGGLAYDLSRGWALKSELDNAVDAAALAGATQLDGQAGAQSRARQAAQGALLSNAQRLGGAIEANVAIASADITFLTALKPSHQAATNDGDTVFIQINLSPRTMGLVFSAFTKVASINASSHAVAGYGAAICKVPPLMICNPDEPAGNTNVNLPFAANSRIGDGIVMKSGGGGAFAPGNFGFLQVQPFNGAANVGAIKDAMARVDPQIECFGKTVQTQPGNISSIDQYFNVRFDLYANGTGISTSDPAYQPALNTITGLSKTSGGGASVCKPQSTGTAFSGNGAAGVVAMPLPRDQCAYNNGSCTNTVGNGVWDKTSYFAVNHHASDLNTVNWSTYGPAPSSGSGPTRYQVYNWELEALNNNNTSIWKNAAQGQTATAANVDQAKPQCYTGAKTQASPDRRTLSAVVVDCHANNVQGQSTATTVGAVDVFLTEPVFGNGGAFFIYGEILGVTSPGTPVGKQTQLYSVKLYE
jgi:hypothetical protein